MVAALKNTGIKAPVGVTALGNVASVVDGLNSLEIPFGTAALPGLAFKGDPDTGVFRQAANAVGFSAGGVERARLTTGQFLGSDGAAATPFWSFLSAPSSGFFKSGEIDAEITVALEGVASFQFRRIIGINAFITGDGNASLPGLTFFGDADTGLFSAGANLLGVSVGGTERARFSTGQLLTADGTAAAPYLSFLSDPDTGIFREGADAIGFSAGGVQKVRIGLLQVFAQDGAALTPTYSFLTDSNTGIFRQAADSIGFSTAGVERYRIDASGNLTMRGNFDFTPSADNAGEVGTNALRWNRIRGVTIVSGDFGFENGWALTEDWKRGGIRLLRPDGSEAARWS